MSNGKVWAIIALICSVIWGRTADTGSFSVTVRVEGLRNSKGIIQYSLYDHGGTIPDLKLKNALVKKAGTIENGISVITFNNLPEGEYAVSVVHDENENGKIDKGFLLPKEGIGFSNITVISLLNRPNFSKASFELKEDRTLTIKVVYM